jgi:hypothetical protein
LLPHVLLPHVLLPHVLLPHVLLLLKVLSASQTIACLMSRKTRRPAIKPSSASIFQIMELSHCVK